LLNPGKLFEKDENANGNQETQAKDQGPEEAEEARSQQAIVDGEAENRRVAEALSRDWVVAVFVAVGRTATDLLRGIFWSRQPQPRVSVEAVVAHSSVDIARHRSVLYSAS
jgi:hypothetical protein